MFQCTSMTTLFPDCSQMAWTAVVVDETIMLARMLFYNHMSKEHMCCDISQTNDMLSVLLFGLWSSFSSETVT